MGLFYEPQVHSTTSLVPVVDRALQMEPIEDRDRRVQVVAQMLGLDGAQAGVTAPNPVWWRVIVAFALAGALFVGAIVLENSPEHAESSKSLLHVFEIAFTAILALLGIETAKQKP